MPRLQHQLLDPPAGYASYFSETNLPENRCQFLKGFLPARFGQQRQAPQLRDVVTLTFDAVAVFPYYSQSGDYDQLVIIRSNATVYAGALKLSTSYNAFQYNPYNGRQHVALNRDTTAGRLCAPTNVSFTTGSLGTQCDTARAIQFDNELFIFNASSTTSSNIGLMARFYVDSSGNRHLYAVNPGTISWAATGAVDSGVAGNLSIGVYRYAIAPVDELGREGPLIVEDNSGNPVTVTLTAANKITVQNYTVGAGSAPGGFNIYRTVANGSTFLFVANDSASPYTDNTADIDLGDAAPEVGENDAPLGATFAAVYKDRLVLNSVNFPQNIQISNAGAPTQFSSIPLPTNPSDGLTIGVGTDTGAQVTGLANDGSLLAIFLRRSVKVLQGNDSTDFEVVEVHKRGAINHDSLARCENVTPFLSTDGVYEMAYNNAFMIRKISLDIENFFFDDADTVGNGNESDFVKRIMAAATAGSLFGIYWDNLYLLALPMQTLAYDLVAEGWSQTGWGLISSAAVYSQAGTPNACFVLTRTNASVKPRTIKYFHDMQSWDDPDALPYNNSEEITRLFDGDGPASERVKKAIRFSLWGSSAKPNGTVIGSLTIYTDQGYTSEPYPIVVGQVTSEASAIFQQEFDDAAVGRHIWFRIWINDPSFIGSDRMLEYSSYDSNG